MKNYIYYLPIAVLALFTSCYDDIEGDEIVYDINLNAIYENEKHGGTIDPDFGLKILFENRNGDNLVDKLITPENKSPYSNTYYIKKNPEFIINGNLINYKKGVENYIDSDVDFLSIYDGTEKLLDAIPFNFYMYLAKFTSINYYKNREWIVETNLVLPEIFNDEKMHTLKYTLVVGNTYEYRQNHDLDYGERTRSYLKNISLDGQLLDLIDYQLPNLENQYIVKAIV